MSACCPVAMCDGPDCLQLTEREAQVCMAICSSDKPVAFSALRERLGYHQEVVSRILKRLANHGAIEKFRGKYRRVSQ
jgi:DNA-binding MarR family transcriptional regulator